MAIPSFLWIQQGLGLTAVFVVIAVLFAAGAWVAIPAVIPFLSLDAWFLFAQHASRAVDVEVREVAA